MRSTEHSKQNNYEYSVTVVIKIAHMSVVPSSVLRPYGRFVSGYVRLGNKSNTTSGVYYARLTKEKEFLFMHVACACVL